jgi:microcystin-dependent protein
LLPINQNQALFSLLGTNYGGDGRVNFGLPNLQGRAPMHMGSGHTLGERGGEQGHTVSISEMPTHVHVFNGSTTNAAAFNPTNAVLARGTTAVGGNPINYYSQTNSNIVALMPQDVGNTGGSQAHLNMQPFLVLNFCIALQGIFPSQT